MADITNNNIKESFMQSIYLMIQQSIVEHPCKGTIIAFNFASAFFPIDYQNLFYNQS